MIKLITFASLAILLLSCNRGVSPHQAATKGGLKCNKNFIK